MRRWWWVVLLCLSLGLNAGILATLALQKSGPGRALESPQPPPPEFRRLADRLELEAPSRRQLTQLQVRLFEEVRFHRQAVERTRLALRRELRAPEPDEGRVNQMVRELAEHYAALEGALARHVLDARELLPAEKERVYLEMLGRFLSRQEGSQPRGLRPPLPRDRDRPGRSRPRQPQP